MPQSRFNLNASKPFNPRDLMRVLTFLPVLIFWSSFPVIFIWVTCRSFASGIALLKICQQREAAGVRFRGTAEVAKCRIIQDEARQSLMDHALEMERRKADRGYPVEKGPPVCSEPD